MAPDLIGLGLARARWFARLAGFSLAIASQVVDGPPGRVLAQYPAGGQRSRQGARIQVALSGPEAAVPEVRGELEARACERILGAGLLVGHRHEEPSDGTAAGTVMRTSPRAGSLVPAGASVDLVVAPDRRVPREAPLDWNRFQPNLEPPFDQQLPRYRRHTVSGRDQPTFAALCRLTRCSDQLRQTPGGR